MELMVGIEEDDDLRGRLTSGREIK